MIPMTLSSTSPAPPPAGRASGAHPESGRGAADDTTGFSLDDGQAQPASDDGPDMGLVPGADASPARALSKDQGAYRWAEPDGSAARNWPMPDQSAGATAQSAVTTALVTQGTAPDPTPQPTGADLTPGGPAKPATAPAATGPAAVTVTPAAATGSQDIAPLIPQTAPMPTLRHGSGRAQQQSDHPAPTQAQPATPVAAAHAAGPTEAPTTATTPPTELSVTMIDGGGDAGMLARDAEQPRADPARADGLRTDQPRADVARAAGTQLVEAVRHVSNGNTEVALNPEELGRVRLGLTTQDGALHVSVMAERPETQDMLRRNIGQLQTDFRALGYTDVTFDFGPGGEQTARQPVPEPRLAALGDGIDPGGPAGDKVIPTSAAVSPPTGATARLDLRI